MTINNYIINYAELDENAERGAQMLDKRRPGWHRKISLDELNMADGSCCVIGQNFNGSYAPAVRGLSAGSSPHLASSQYAWEIDHGFLPPVLNAPLFPDPAFSVEEFAHLGKAWERQIQDRLIADMPGDRA